MYVQAAYVSHQIRGKLLIKRKQALINCHAVLPDDVSNVIVLLHVLTGSDHTSGLYGHGKKLLQKLMKDPEARELLGRVGESLVLKNEFKADMKAFILSKVFVEDIALTCEQARASKWQKLKKKSYSPPSTWWWHTKPPLHTNKFHHILPSQFNFGGTSNPNWPWLGNHQWQMSTSALHAATIAPPGNGSWTFAQ